MEEYEKALALARKYTQDGHPFMINATSMLELMQVADALIHAEAERVEYESRITFKDAVIAKQGNKVQALQAEVARLREALGVTSSRASNLLQLMYEFEGEPQIWGEAMAYLDRQLEANKVALTQDKENEVVAEQTKNTDNKAAS